MTECNLKWLLIGVCILIVLIGLYLAFFRERRNIRKDVSDLQTIKIDSEKKTLDITGAIGIILILIGLFCAIYCAMNLKCENVIPDNSCNFEALVKKYTLLSGIDNEQDRTMQKHTFRKDVANCLNSGNLKIEKNKLTEDKREGALLILATSIQTFPEKDDKNLIFESYRNAFDHYTHHAYYDALKTLIRNGFVGSSDTSKVSEVIKKFKSIDKQDNLDEATEILKSLGIVIVISKLKPPVPINNTPAINYPYIAGTYIHTMKSGKEIFTIQQDTVNKKIIKVDITYDFNSLHHEGSGSFFSKDSATILLRRKVDDLCNLILGWKIVNEIQINNTLYIDTSATCNGLNTKDYPAHNKLYKELE